jgi:hypothetical protein
MARIRPRTLIADLVYPAKFGLCPINRYTALMAYRNGKTMSRFDPKWSVPAPAVGRQT